MGQNAAEILREKTYIANVEAALAETPGKFTHHAKNTSETGSTIKIGDEFGHLKMREIEGRNSNTNNTDIDWKRRWMMKPKRAGVAPLIDPDDRMSTSVDLKSPLVQGVARAARMYHDDQFLAGFYGTAHEGNEDGMTSIAFKAGNVLAADFGETANSFTGLTKRKLRQIRKMVRKRKVSLEREQGLFMIVTAEEIDDLLAIDEFINFDYGVNKALEHGEIRDWLGFTFIPAELDDSEAYPKGSQLLHNSSGHRRLPIWVPSGMQVNTWLEFEGHTDILANMNHSEQIAGYACSGASRTNEDKCFIMETVD